MADPMAPLPGTHHVLLAEAVKLLHLLGHEELGTAHGTPDLLQDWQGGEQTVSAPMGHRACPCMVGTCTPLHLAKPWGNSSLLQTPLIPKGFLVFLVPTQPL